MSSAVEQAVLSTEIGCEFEILESRIEWKGIEDMPKQ